MRTNKELIYEYIQKSYIIDGTEDFTTQYLSEYFELKRPNVSKVLNELVNEGSLQKIAGRPVKYTLTNRESRINYKASFETVIGYNGSLKKSVQIAQAAILYPNENLNILVSSHHGSGRTLFIEKIFEYAYNKRVINTDSELVKVNCKYYQKDSTALTEVIFGNEIEESIFFAAKNGMLFIDNAELLSAKDTERINYLLKTGRLEGTDIDFSDVLIVIGINQDYSDSFSRNIPMLIELPDYQHRPMGERLAIINQFFSREAINSNCIIKVSNEVIKALAIHNFPNNIKDLEIEIKNLCAKAYVRTMNDQSETIVVTESDLTIKTRSGLINLKKYQEELHHYLGNSEVLYFDPANDFTEEMSQSNLNIEDLYDTLNKQYNELSLRGFDVENIGNVMDSHIKNLFSRYNYFRGPTDRFDLSNLNSIVDAEVLTIISEFMEFCKISLRRQFSPSVVYGLALHINSLTENEFRKNRVSNNQIKQVVKNYPEEYSLSIKFAEKIKQALHLELPMEEIVIITMFLIETPEKNIESHPVLLYIFHGIGVASSLMHVTNNLTQLDNCYSYDLDLSKKPEVAAEEIEQLLYDIDEGKGVIVIYDMGSIKTILDSIIDRTTIKIRTFQFPITLVGMDIARKSMVEHNIDTVYHQATNDIFRIVDNNYDKVSLIITLCYTSEGGAVQLKQYIDQYSKLNYKTIALSVSNKEELSTQVNELRKFYNIRAFVGTFDPKLFGIPYISLHDIFSTPKESVDKMLTFSPINGKSSIFDVIYQNLEEQFTYTPIKKLKKVLPPIIEKLDEYYNLDEDSSIGLFMHLASVVERKLAGDNTLENDITTDLIEQFPSDYDLILKNISVLEKEFNIIINNQEIVMMIMIVKKL